MGWWRDCMLVLHWAKCWETLLVHPLEVHLAKCLDLLWDLMLGECSDWSMGFLLVLHWAMYWVRWLGLQWEEHLGKRWGWS